MQNGEHRYGIPNLQAEAGRHHPGKIYGCAVSLFARNSYENVTVHDICRASQVSVGAFYHHFKTKESILNEGCRLFDEQLEQVWREGHPGNHWEAIRSLVAHQMRFTAQMGAPAAGQYVKNQLSNEEKYILNPTASSAGPFWAPPGGRWRQAA